MTKIFIRNFLKAALRIAPVLYATLWISAPGLEAQVDVEINSPDLPGTSSAPTLSPLDREALWRRHIQSRERAAALVNQNPPSPPALAWSPVLPARISSFGGEFHGGPDAFLIGRNNRDVPPGGSGPSIVSEPAAANAGPHVLYTGNWHEEYSVDGGVTWTNLPISGGPASAPNFCCDQDVIYDRARGVTFHSKLYLNTAGTDGAVRISVRRNIDQPDDCSFTWETADPTVVPDYPHLGISSKFLYLGVNLMNNGTWVGSRIRRYNIDQMVDCVNTTVNIFTYGPAVATGQRILVPAEGLNTRDRMYFGLLENTTQIRIFRWLESDAQPTSFLRAISASAHNNPPCAGGVNGTDWIESSIGWSINGFTMRAALGGNKRDGALLGFWWDVGSDVHTELGHVHSAVFSEPALTLVSEPHIFNNTACFGYPAVSANDRGDFGISIAWGGNAGVGGPAVQGYVAMADEFSSATPGAFATFFGVATGTHNPPVGDRYGDYLTVRPHEPCTLWFSATSYALDGGTASSNVNLRYVEFGRGRDQKCYYGWRSAVKAP
jgi:hypothetical protein